MAREKSKSKAKTKAKKAKKKKNFVLSDKELKKASGRVAAKRKLNVKIGAVASARNIFDGGGVMEPAGAQGGRQTPLRINPRGFPGGFDPGGIVARKRRTSS
jgi:hypothetical protein